MSKKKPMRKRIFVDAPFQGAIAFRVVLYWLMCLVAVTLMLLCWRIITGPARLFYTHFDDMWFFYGPALVASLMLLPIVVIDSIRLTHRAAGPMVRLRRAMQELARGQQVSPIRFRDGDFWQDFARDFNAVVARVQGQGLNLKSGKAEPVAAVEEASEEPVGAGVEG